MLPVKVLIRRDSIENFAVSDYIPRESELTAAYSNDGNQVIFKLGDGKKRWSDLCEVTKISELGVFNVYTSQYNTKPTIEMVLDPFKIQEVLGKQKETEVKV